MCFIILDTCLHDEELQLPALCKDIGYTSIKLPNHLGHRTVAEAGLELHQYFPVVKVNKQSTFSLKYNKQKTNKIDLQYPNILYFN